MKHFLILLMLSVVGFSGCKKSNSTTTVDDQYYVKYQVTSTTIYTGNKLEVYYRSDNNQVLKETDNTPGGWSITIGPVKKGFNASVQVNELGNNYGHLTLQSQISVSKNNSVFATKASDNSTTPRTSLQLGYTINY